jgi:hypothetical protein
MKSKVTRFGLIGGLMIGGAIAVGGCSSAPDEQDGQDEEVTGQADQAVRANGDCCFGRCRTGTLMINRSLRSGCNEFVHSWCGRAGFSNAWWGSC